jgi:hypothetical protein
MDLNFQVVGVIYLSRRSLTKTDPPTECNGGCEWISAQSIPISCKPLRHGGTELAFRVEG